MLLLLPFSDSDRPRGRDGTEVFSLWSSEQAVDGFTLDQVAEKRNILGNFEKIDQPCTGAEQADHRLANSKSMRLNRGLGFRKIFQAEDLPHCRHIVAAGELFLEAKPVSKSTARRELFLLSL